MMANFDLPHIQSDQLRFGLPQNGVSLFSTQNGRLPPRSSPCNHMPYVLRDDPIGDRIQMVAKLQEDSPDICAMVKQEVTYDTLHDWFDHRDVYMHGAEFLRLVLSDIAIQNQIRLNDFVERWRAANTEAFVRMLPGHNVEHLFSPEDKEEYGLDFLTDATAEIKRMKAREEEQKRIRIPERHAQMIQDQRGSFVSQALATAPRVASNAPRAASNPERYFFHSYPHHTRQIPPPNAPFAGQVDRLPLPRLTGATEVLEHIVPGATTRGDFHSDPLATLGRSYPDTMTAIPSRGFPGPYSYFPGEPVSLDDRGRKFSGNIPKGKKNPIKRSSDDARRQSDADTGHRSLPNSGTSHDYPASSSQNNTQQHMSQINNGQYPVHQWQSNEYKVHQYHPHMDDMGTSILASAPHPQPKNSGDASEGITFQPAPNFRSSRSGTDNPQCTQWAPNNASDGQRSVLANMSNSGQPQLQHSPVARQGAYSGDKIWIGAIPPNFTKDMLLKLLEPCRGLRHISDPKRSQSDRAAFVFAAFRDSGCAREALDRIPRTQFAMLPEGHILVTNWPRASASTRGEYKERRALDQSPAKSRKDGEYMNHRRLASLTTSENRTTMLESLPDTPRKTADVDGRRSRGMVVGPDHRQEHPPSPNKRDATTVPKETKDALPTTSGAKPLTDKAVTKINPTALPLRMSPETDKPSHQRDTDTHADSSSNPVVVQHNAEVGSRSDPLEMTDKAVPSQALCPSTMDGIQETASQPRPKNSNKKKNKTKSMKKTAAVESGAVTTTQGVPDVEQTTLQIAAEADSTKNTGSKAMDSPLEMEKHDLPHHSERKAPRKSATTGLSGPHAKTSEANLIVTNSASILQGAGLSSSGQPEIYSNASNPGPSDGLHYDPTHKAHTPNKNSKSLAPVAPAVPSNLDREPESQAMTRATSMSTEYNAVFNPTSTAPSSFLVTERKNSIAEESYLHSLNAHTAPLERTKQTTAGVNAEQLRSKLEAQATATTSETSDAAKGYVMGSQHATNEIVKKGKKKDDVPKKASVPTTPPRSQSSIRTPTSSRSPERKQAPDIPQRSSSLSVSSTPIHTRLRKKPKNFSSVTEEAPGEATPQIAPAEEHPETQKRELPARQSNVSSPANTSPSAHGGSSRSNKQKRANNPKAKSFTVHAPTSPTPSSKREHLPKPEMPYYIGDEDSIAINISAAAQQALPKPERPFCTDDGAGLPVPDLSEIGQHNVTLEYNSLEDLFSQFASDLPSPDPPMMSSMSSKRMVTPSPPDTRSYNSRLKREIDDFLGHKARETTLVNADGLVPLKSQQRVWGDVLSVHAYPDKSDSRTDPEKWAFWAVDFLRPDTTQPPPLVHELGMNIKYLAGTSIRYQNKFFPPSGATSALLQEYEEGMTLVEQMPGSPWAQVTPHEWEGLAIDFRQRLMAKYQVSFPTSTKPPEGDISTVIDRKPKGGSNKSSSVPDQDNKISVKALLNSLKQRQAMISVEMAHANECGLDKSALEFESEEVQYFVDNSPRELTSQVEPGEWESMASYLLSQAKEPPQHDQSQQPSIVRSFPEQNSQQKLLSEANELEIKGTSFPEEEEQAAVLSRVQKRLLELSVHESTEDWLKLPLQIEQAAQGYASNSHAASDEERAVMPSRPNTTGGKGYLEEQAASSVSTSVPADTGSLMLTSKDPATSGLSKDNQEKQSKDIVDGFQGLEMDLERGELAKSIARERTERNHDEQVRRQSEVLMVGPSSKFDKTFGTDAQTVDRTTEKKLEYQGGTRGQEPQTTQAVEPDSDHTADRKPGDITIEESNEQKQAVHDDPGRTSLKGPGTRAEDQLTRRTGPAAEVKVEEDVSSRAEEKQVDDTRESNEQSQKQVELQEEAAESKAENTNLDTGPETPEKPTNEVKVFTTLRSQVKDVKNDPETNDVKKDATAALELLERSPHERALSTSSSSAVRYTPSSSDANPSPPGSDVHSSPTKSEAPNLEDDIKTPARIRNGEESPLAIRGGGPIMGGKSSPTNSKAPDIEDNTETPARVSQGEGSPLAIKGGGPNMGGKKTYAELAKEPASGSGIGNGGGTQTEAKSDPWAVPEGEVAWGEEEK